jgi:DNA modification methylase
MTSIVSKPTRIWPESYVNHIVCGDAPTVLRTMPEQVIQTCITSPPYWSLRDYGTDGQLGLESTPEEYVAKMVEIFREVRRVLKDDGTLWLNLGDSYAGNTTGSLGGETSMLEGGKTTQRMALNRPDKTGAGLKPKDLVGIPWRVAFALQADGWYLRSDIIWAKPNPMPESVTDRPTKAHEYIFLVTKNERYYYDADAIREPQADTKYTRERYRYKPSPGKKALKNPDVNCCGDELAYSFGDGTGYRNKRSVWTIPTEPFPEAHFATFPQKLVEPCVMAGSRRGDIVLDPFMGSGTVGAVAKRLSRKYVGIELSEGYCRMAARTRLAQEEMF